MKPKFLIEKPGAYPEITNFQYHHDPLLLPAPSLSSSGAKTLLSKSAYHFWATSPMNPNLPPRQPSEALIFGQLGHDMALFPNEWRNMYHVLPDGFTESHYNKWANAIKARDFAISKGKTVVSRALFDRVISCARAIGMDSMASSALRNGVNEITLAWQDKETGVWLRCKPDFLPNAIIQGRQITAVSDLKFMAPEYCSPQGFSGAIRRFGYHLSAAFYFEGIEHVYGNRPTYWNHVVIEKEEPFTVSNYPLPEEDIERGKFQMRKAIHKFAECLDRGTEAQHWPAYTSAEPIMVGLNTFARNTIDQHGSEQDAAMINAG
ncbi:PD-(D/E)XK nuclease-like domain-containing protein [Parasphingorhabdus sp.]|uniref:PD-(D/E)XK nuclease-like domain-containing protein n=1 Tax=Parasphingorhabdus sp. TaxID=2709688 RepID=UPI003A8E7867